MLLSILSAYLTEILIGAGTLITIYIIQNTELKEGLTSLFLDRVKNNGFKIEDHMVKDTLIDLKFKTKHTNFDNNIKNEIYHYYVETTLVTMEYLVDNILFNYKDMRLNELKIHIKSNLYDKLSEINSEFDKRILLPEELSPKFNKFKNYLTKQHTYAIDNALKINHKHMLVIKVLDAIESNSMWFIFYTNEMFTNFNGHFDSLNKDDVLRL